MSHYDVLGLKQTATQAQIKSAYYKLSKKYHPDVATNVANAKEKFTRLTAAYEVLNNPQKRAVYDRTLHCGMGVSTTFTPGSDFDAEYREFLRRRGSFRPRTSEYTSPGTSGRERINYEEFFRHQQQYYGRTMQDNWDARRKFEYRMRQRLAANMALFWLFIMFIAGLAVGASSQK